VRLSLRKKLFFSAVVTAASLLALEGVLALMGVRPVLYGEDPYVGFSSRIPLFVERPGPGGEKEMTTAENKLTFFNHQSFNASKPVGTFRIFCLGGSTTYGRPYDDATSFCGWLREFLPQADPSRRWELINAGGISYASYRVALLTEELIRYQPDLFIVYSGQNEFLERRTYGPIIEMPQAARGLGAAVHRTRTFAAVKHAMDTIRGRAPSPRDAGALLPGEVETLLDDSVGPEAYHRDDAFQKQVMDHYRHNLSRIVDVARSVGARVLLVAPASNLLDCSPFKSEHRDGLERADLQRWQTLFDRAGEAQTAGRWNEALEALDAAAAIDDRHAELHFRRGRVLVERGEYSRAKAALERARDEDVCPLRALGPMAGIVAQVARQRRVPLVDFAGLVEERSPHGIPGENLFLDHVHPTVEGNRMLALAILGEMARQDMASPRETWNDAAIEQVSRQVESRLDPQSQATALRNLAKVLSWAGKFDEARRLAERALEMEPEDAVAYFQLALCAQREGKLERAESLYRQAIAADPRYAAAYTNLGTVLEQRGEVGPAMDYFRQAIAIDAGAHKALFNLGDLLLKRGEFSSAADRFRRVIELRPADAQAHAQLAAALVPLGRIPEAIEQMEEAIRLEPDDAGHHNKLGSLLAAAGDHAGAERSYRKALELDDNHLGAMENLAWLLATTPDKTLRDGDEALRLAERVSREGDSGDPESLDTLAVALAQSGRFDRAIETARQAIRLAESQGRSAHAEAIRRRLELFRNHRPYRE
jgi:tetratricopeptide (TPR) repeat protein